MPAAKSRGSPIASPSSRSNADIIFGLFYFCAPETARNVFLLHPCHALFKKFKTGDFCWTRFSLCRAALDLARNGYPRFRAKK
jgi:hypothetical protein